MNTKIAAGSAAKQNPSALLGHTTWSARIRAAGHGAGLAAVVILLFTIFGIARPAFATGDNVMAILLQASVVGIMAIGQTYVLMTGGIDLSIGSILAVSAVSAGVFTQVVPAPLAILGGIGVGALAGLVNGILITVTRITPFIVTLGTMSIYAGLALIITGGRAVYDIPQGYKDALAGRIAGVPIPIVIVLLLTVLCVLVMKFTKFGEHLIAVGGNPETSRLAGLKVKSITASTYVISGGAAGLAGAILVARLGAADPTTGADLLLIAIAATVMGGTKLTGGEGSMFGALLGAVLIATLTAGLTSLNVQAFYQQVAVGAAIIIALLVDRVARGRSAQ